MLNSTRCKTSTFLEGLLPFTICATRLAGVVDDGKSAVSTSFGSPLFSFSCELGGPTTSLLGTGVRFLTADLLNAGFLMIGKDGFEALTLFEVSLASETPFADPGVALPAFFVKKLWILRCPDADPALEACFFKEGVARAGVALESFGLPMLDIVNGRGKGIKNGG